MLWCMQWAKKQSATSLEVEEQTINISAISMCVMYTAHFVTRFVHNCTEIVLRQSEGLWIFKRISTRWALLEASFLGLLVFFYNLKTLPICGEGILQKEYFFSIFLKSFVSNHQLFFPVWGCNELKGLSLLRLILLESKPHSVGPVFIFSSN